MGSQTLLVYLGLVFFLWIAGMVWLMWYIERHLHRALDKGVTEEESGSQTEGDPR